VRRTTSVLDFLPMARNSPKNPLNDIVGQAGGWLGGAASSLNTFLTGQDNPSLNPQTRRVVSASQTVGDVVTGGAVTAMKGGPDAVTRYAAQQAAVYAAGLAFEPAVEAAVTTAKILKNPVTRAQVLRRGEDAVWITKQTLREAMPVSGKTASNLRRNLAQARQQAMEAGLDLEDARRLARQPDSQYMKLFNQSVIMDDATKLARNLPLERQATTRGAINRAIQKGAEFPFGKAAEDIESDVRLTNRYLREKGRFVAKRAEMLKNDPEFRRQINEALLRQQAKTNARKVVDEAMRDITDQSIRKFQGPK
jgi:hypothetical protein